jgi:hypothetical protein
MSLADIRKQFPEPTLRERFPENFRVPYESHSGGGKLNAAASAFLNKTVMDGEKHSLLPSAVGSFKVHGYSLSEATIIILGCGWKDASAGRFIKKLWER